MRLRASFKDVQGKGADLQRWFTLKRKRRLGRRNRVEGLVETGSRGASQAATYASSALLTALSAPPVASQGPARLEASEMRRRGRTKARWLPH
jgi:hypothetical protein